MEAVYTNLVLGWAGFRHEIQQRLSWVKNRLNVAAYDLAGRNA